MKARRIIGASIFLGLVLLLHSSSCARPAQYVDITRVQIKRKTSRNYNK